MKKNENAGLKAWDKPSEPVSKALASMASVIRRKYAFAAPIVNGMTCCFCLRLQEHFPTVKPEMLAVAADLVAQEWNCDMLECKFDEVYTLKNMRTGEFATYVSPDKFSQCLHKWFPNA